MKKIIPLIFLFLGILLFFHPILADFSLLSGDSEDGRFFMYILEHGYLFFIKDAFCNSFWNLPFFYPNLNTLSYSDILLVPTILYIPFRHFFDMYTSFQIVAFLMCILNFCSFYLFSRKIFKFDFLISSISAFLFAFSLPRYAQMGHLQLYTQFLSVFGIYFFLSANKRKIYFILSAIFLSLQFYSSYYLGWFICFGAFIAGVIFLLNKSLRKALFVYVKENWNNLLIFLIVFFSLSFPLIYHYLKIDSSGFKYSAAYLPTVTSFLFSHSLLDSKIVNLNIEYLNIETITGMGFLTTFFAFLGFLKLKKYKVQIALFVLLSTFFFWNIPYNYLLYKFFIGASAIRAGGRVVFLVLPVFSFLLGYFFSKIKSKKIVWIFLILFLIEQYPFVKFLKWHKHERDEIINQYEVLKECDTFYIDSIKNNDRLDAMYLSLKIKKPTHNGYSGYMPKVILPENKKCIIKPIAQVIK